MVWGRGIPLGTLEERDALPQRTHPCLSVLVSEMKSLETIYLTMILLERVELLFRILIITSDALYTYVFYHHLV